MCYSVLAGVYIYIYIPAFGVNMLYACAVTNQSTPTHKVWLLYKMATSAEDSTKRVFLITGGTGLVGKAIEEVMKEEGIKGNDEWIFLSSKDGDLR